MKRVGSVQAFGQCWRWSVVAALGLALVAGPAPAIRADTPTTERVSLTQGGAQANNISFNPAISADGRYVAFESAASNLVPGGAAGHRNIFIRDRATGTTELVSVAAGGTGADGNSFNPAISPDGRYVAFDSEATNLVASDTNGFPDVFVRDRLTGTTERVSVASGGAQGNSSSGRPAISADGRYVAFESAASNLVAGGTFGNFDIFVRDRLTGTTERVSVTSGGVPANLSTNFHAAISADGRYVAFQSSATNLVAGDSNGAFDIFVRDRLTGTTERLSVASGTIQANGNSFNPAISADGRYVAFVSAASNLVAGDTNGHRDVFVRDRATSTTDRISVAFDGGQGDADSVGPTISADGRYVAFQSGATNLVADDTNNVSDLFVRDRATGTIERVSLTAGGTQANGATTFHAISADGRYVAFESASSNLVAGDTNGVRDIFVRDRATDAEPRLSVSDAQVTEGSGFRPGTLVFTVSLSAVSSQDVSFRFWTEDVSARNGADYHGTFGTRTIPAGGTSTTITVALFGDSTFEQNDTMHLNIDTPLNATIADGQGVGTILNDDPRIGGTLSLGTFDLTPANAAVAVGEHLTYRLTWTVPSGSWHELQSVDLRIGEGGSVLWVRFDEASGTLGLVDPANGSLGPAFAPGRSNRLETRAATLYLAGSSIQGSGPSGPSVTLTLDLSFKPQAAGRSEPVEVRATNDAGGVQGFDHAATLTVERRHR